MRTIRTSGAAWRLFAVASVGFGVVFGAVGRLYGEDIAAKLQETPTTTTGWHFFGWLIAGPPIVLALIAWHERERLSERQLTGIGLALSAWLGLSMMVLPSRIHGVDEQFGTGALVGEPLSIGWAWGALANVVALIFAAAVYWVLRSSVRGRPTRPQRELTARLLERAWVALLAIALLFAIYGDGAGIFQTSS